MTKVKCLGLTAFLAPLALAVAMTGWGGEGRAWGQAAPTTQPVYTMDARPQITDLKVAPLRPKNAEDLKAIEQRVEAVVRQAMPATVGLIMSDGQGSGVIVSKDGYVLTAGHVSGPAGTRVTVVLSNGQTAQARSLGANNWVDSGMVKIETPGEYPYMPLGTAVKMEQGQWVIAMGHPGGYQEGRQPVVRLGRVLSLNYTQPGGAERQLTAIATDSTLINGDSGGPVFDLDGRVVGINSRIGLSTTQNIHVPVDQFMKDWGHLAAGEVWGGRRGALAGGPRRGGGGGGAGRGTPAPGAVTPATPSVVAPTPAAKPRLGFKVIDENSRVVITDVFPGTPAEEAKLQKGDVINKFDGTVVHSSDDLSDLLAKHKPGETIVLDLQRGGGSKQLPLKVGSQ